MSRIVQGAERFQGPSIHGLLEDWTERTPDAVALAAPGRPPLSYRRLRSQVEMVVQALRANGVARNDRVALVLPDGPELAVA
jgi:non-ribosomal peptide synthetase component F